MKGRLWSRLLLYLEGGATGVLQGPILLEHSNICSLSFFPFLTIKDKKSKDQDIETWMGSSGPLPQTPRRHKCKV